MFQKKEREETWRTAAEEEWAPANLLPQHLARRRRPHALALADQETSAAGGAQKAAPGRAVRATEWRSGSGGRAADGGGAHHREPARWHG